MAYDLVVTGGVVVDGTGLARRRADVGVRDGRVVEVGHLSEPVGGAHTDPAAAARFVDDVLARVLAEVCSMTGETRLARRYDKFRNMGRAGVDFVEEGN